MNEYQSLNHTKWECKYPVVFIPKYRRKALYGSLRKRLGTVFRELAQQKECKIEAGHLMVDHVDMLLSIPPKYSVSQVLGYLKGKSAIHIARTYGGKRRNFVGQHFWARGYWVSTVGHNEAAVRLYIQEQEKEDQRLGPLGLFEGESRFERFIFSSLRLCRRFLTNWKLLMACLLG
jgi:putative transposase